MNRFLPVLVLLAIAVSVSAVDPANISSRRVLGLFFTDASDSTPEIVTKATPLPTHDYGPTSAYQSAWSVATQSASWTVTDATTTEVEFTNAGATTAWLSIGSVATVSSGIPIATGASYKRKAYYGQVFAAIASVATTLTRIEDRQ